MIKRIKSLGSVLGEGGSRRKIQLGLAGLALFDLLFYLFAIGPLGDSDRQNRVQLATLQKQVRDRTAQVDRLASVVHKVEIARAGGDELLDTITLSRRTAFSEIVSELDQAAKTAGVDLRDRGINADPIDGSDTLSMLTITQNLEGNYDNLVKFLNQLDRSKRFVIVESLGAAPQQSGAKDTGGKLSVTLKLDAFVKES
jgi:Tfp pilus assembly protein PilO